MNMENRLPVVAMAFMICLISAPIAMFATIALIPFWSWIESSLQIESIGHSGPAEWCYVVTYVIALICVFLTWWIIRLRADISRKTHTDKDL